MRTALTTLFGVRYPIVNAPMTPQAGGELAGAVGPRSTSLIKRSGSEITMPAS